MTWNTVATAAIRRIVDTAPTVPDFIAPLDV